MLSSHLSTSLFPTLKGLLRVYRVVRQQFHVTLHDLHIALPHSALDSRLHAEDVELADAVLFQRLAGLEHFPTHVQAAPPCA